MILIKSPKLEFVLYKTDRKAPCQKSLTLQQQECLIVFNCLIYEVSEA